MALMRLKKKGEDEEQSTIGSDLLRQRQEIRDQNAAYDAAWQAVDDWKSQNGGSASGLPDSLAVNALKQTRGGYVAQPKYVTDPYNPNNWERWSDEYKYLMGQTDVVPASFANLGKKTAVSTEPATMQGKPTTKVKSANGDEKASVPDDYYTEAMANVSGPTPDAEAGDISKWGVPTGADGYPVTGGNYDLSQFTPQQIEDAKRQLITAWNARNPVTGYVIDMNKGTVEVRGNGGTDYWSTALTGVPLEQAQKNADGTYSIPSTAGAVPDAAWLAQFNAANGINGGTNGQGQTQIPYGGNNGTGTGNGTGYGYTQTGYGSVTGTSPYTEGGSGIPTATTPVTAWNGEGRPSFSYELNADPLYQMYREMYLKNGAAASDDAMARAAALTGGYGNSYAEGVGAQAYQQWADKLNDVALKLYDTAYSRYRDDMGDYWKQYGYDYQRERDAINDARYADETAYNRAWNEDARAWDRDWQQKQWDYGVSQDTYNRQRQDWLDSMTGNTYQQGQADIDTQRAASAFSLAYEYAQMGMDPDMILSLVRTQYANSVDDGALEQYATAAYNAYRNGISAQQAAAALKQQQSDAAAAQKKQESLTYGNLLKNAQTYWKNSNGDANAVYQALIDDGFSQKDAAYAVSLMGNDGTSGEKGGKADYVSFNKDVDSLSKSGRLTYQAGMALASQYNIPQEIAIEMLNEFNFQKNDEYPEAKDTEVSAFMQSHPAEHFGNQYADYGSVTYNGTTYNSVEEAERALNADLDAEIAAGRMNEATADYIAAYVLGVNGRKVSPTGSYYTVSNNTVGGDHGGGSNGQGTNTTQGQSSFTDDMKASDAKSVEEKLKTATSQNDAARVLNAWKHVLNEAEYNRLWDKYVEGFNSLHGINQGGR